MSSRWRAFPSVTHVIGRAEIDRYAELSGDTNPLHMDPEFAAATQFGTVIAHGPIALQTIFEAVATWLDVEDVPPGVRIEVAYRAPVRIGDAITCTGQVASDRAGVVTVEAGCANQDGHEVLQGLVLVPRQLAPRTATSGSA